MDAFFNTFGQTGGVIVLLIAGIVVFLLIAAVLERRTKQIFPDRRDPDDTDFSDSDDE